MFNPIPPLPAPDLDRMFSGLNEDEWHFFTHKRIFITGGTGFLGKWLLSALITANQRLHLNCRIYVLSRYPQTFIESSPHLANAEGVVLLAGDVRTYNFTDGNLNLIVHGGTDIVAQISPSEMFSTCVDGTRNILELARSAGAEDFLLLSSGAIYGPHPPMRGGVDETYTGGPKTTLLSSAYAEGKRVSEWLTCAAATESNLRVKIARIYAQVGPYLPLGGHFAIGNFIRDALANSEITVLGDGSPHRSYLYAADTIIWLLAMILRGESGRAWNVGGNEGMSISELATKIAVLLGPNKQVKITKKIDPKKQIEYYIPNTTRAKLELNPPTPLSLEESILRTAVWLNDNGAFNEHGDR